MRKNSIKNTRVNAEVQRELSTILRGGIKDPRVAPMDIGCSGTGSSGSEDLQGIYQRAWAHEEAQADTLKSDLQSAEGYIRRRACTYI